MPRKMHSNSFVCVMYACKVGKTCFLYKSNLFSCYITIVIVYLLIQDFFCNLPDSRVILIYFLATYQIGARAHEGMTTSPIC